MEDVAFCESVSEKDAASSILKVLDIINFLLETGEITVPDGM